MRVLRSCSTAALRPLSYDSRNIPCRCYVTEAVMGGSWSNQRQTYQPAPAQSCSNHNRICTLPLLTILAAEKSSKEHLHRLLPQFHACISCFCSRLALLLPSGKRPAGRSLISMSIIISMQLTYALQSILWNVTLVQVTRLRRNAVDLMVHGTGICPWI